MKIEVAVLFLVGLSAVCEWSRNRAHESRLGSPSVGLEIGQQAPAFALPDQFGQEQSNETLKGSKGTVLLFFRSADW